MEKLDVIVVGAGVVGLATARQFALQGKQVGIIEVEGLIGSITSSRNSEVIHAGIYYPTNSLKASLCVRGKELLYKYCEEREVPHKKLGKLIVANSSNEVPILENIVKQAEKNGVFDLKPMSGDEVKERYPELKAIAGLWSPSTGIIDSHQFMERLLEDAEEHGAVLALGSKVTSMSSVADGIAMQICTRDGDEYEIIANTVVNCAGLGAWDVAHGVDGIRQESIPPKFLAKGSYFKMLGASPFDTLVYPVPPHGCLGIHLTLDMEGNARFGPSINWIESEDYSVSEQDEKMFRQSIELYYPNVSEQKLMPDYSGIRPKVSGPNEIASDFIFQTEAEHGIKGLINLFGIESPGLTSALAIAAYIEAKVQVA